MSVTIAGVKGYEFQYKVTVLVGLLNLSKASTLFVEKKGSEDAVISITESSGNSIVDIQVKNTSIPITITEFVNWLCHFKERSATDNLLFRIVNTNSAALIVTSARCQDDTAMFIKNLPEMDSHNDMHFNSGWKDIFSNALITNKYTGSTPLQKKRDKFCKDQAAEFKKNSTIINALPKIIIWEQITHDKLDQSVEHILNRQYKIPQSLTNSAYLELLEAVKGGRDYAIDIIPLFKNVLGEKKGNAPSLDPGYQLRSEEAALTDKLENDGLLLLTGRTQCGKSELAKKLADLFYQKGFAYRIFGDVNMVDSFFNLNAVEDKICILEDPWGHLQPLADSFITVRKLNLLVKNRHPNHKLIVTTRQEILDEMKGAGSSAIKIGDKEWENITVSDKDILSRFWKIFANDRNIDKEAISKINNYLESSDKNSLLQIGELQYLARYDQDLKGKTLEELLHIARQTSTELANDLLVKNSDAAELFAVIGFCADTITGLSPADLSYIFSDDESNYSILSDSVFTSGGSIPADPFPAYREQYTLSSKRQQQLEYLESRGLLVIHNEQIWFAHPNYFEAGKKLFIYKSSLRQERLLTYFHKAICCLSPQTSLHATRQLYHLVGFIDQSQITKVLDLGFLAIDSIFPSVADQSLVFLVSHIQVLPPQKRQELEQILNSSDKSSNHIFWKNSIPFISTQGRSFFEDRFYKLPESEFEAIGDKFNTDQVVSSLEAWNFLRTMQNRHDRKLTIKEASYLLQYDELFIRKKTTELTVSEMDRNPNQKLINLIFSDPHPSIVFTAIRAILADWRKWDVSARPGLKDLLLSSLQSEAIAIRANNFLTTFENEERLESINWQIYDEEEQKELWNVWSELYTRYTTKLPANLFLDSTGFGETVNKAFKYLTKENGMSVLYAWYGSIDHKLTSGQVLDDYELAIADVLLEFTDKEPSIRWDLYQKLLRYTDTGFIISTLKWIMYHWDHLEEEERNLIIELTRSNRKDKRWIRAILLTRQFSPPPEIQLELLTKKDIFSNSPNYFIEKIDIGLLEDCLRLYFGHPQPLWWYATQYENITFWQEVVNHILINTVQPFFSMCLRELSSWGLNGFSAPWNGGMDTWRIVCSRSVDKLLLADRFLYDMSRINCSINSAKNMFNILIECFRTDGEEDKLAQAVAGNIELLQQTGHGAEDLLEIIEPLFFDKVIAKLHPDAELVYGLTKLKEDPSGTDAFKNVLLQINQSNMSIRFQPTKKLLKIVLGKLLLLNDFGAEIDKIQDRTQERGEQEKKKRREKDEYKLSDWIGIH